MVENCIAQNTVLVLYKFNDQTFENTTKDNLTFQMLKIVLDWTVLLEEVQPDIPHQTRLCRVFIKTHLTSTYRQKSVVSRQMEADNNLYNCVNLFRTSLASFKKALLRGEKP